MTLAGKTVLVLAENHFEDLELHYPRLRLLEAGARVVVAGLGEKSYVGKKGTTVDVDGDVPSFDPDLFHGVVIPGGWAPDRLRRSIAVLDCVAQIDRKGGLVAAICHAGWVLVSARVAKGRRLTSVGAIRDDLVNAGAVWVDEEVVVDRNLVTSRTPKDLPAFGRAIVEFLSGERRPTAPPPPR